MTLQYFVGGERAESFTALLFQPGSAALERVLEAREGQVSFVPPQHSTHVVAVGGGTLSAPVVLPDSPVDFDLHGLQRSTVHGSVVEAEGLAPIVGAALVAEPSGFPESVVRWAAEAGIVVTASAITDDAGRFSLELLDGLTARIEVKSTGHLGATADVFVSGSSDHGPLFRLTRAEGVQVRLVAGEGALGEGYEIAHTMFGARVPAGADGTAWLPLDPSVAELTVVVFYPDDLELTAFFAPRLAGDESALEILVEGGPLVEVNVVGENPSDQRLLAMLYGEVEGSHEYFTNRWVEPGGHAEFRCCPSGAICVDLGFVNDDRSPLTIARRHVTVDAERGASIAIELPRELRYLRLLDEAGAPCVPAEVWFTTPLDRAWAPVGGRVDGDGRIVVPDRDELQVYVHGFTGTAAEEAFFVDLPLRFDARLAGEPEVRLGPRVSSSVQLVDARNGVPLHEQTFDVCGVQAGGAISSYATGADGAAVALHWHGGSTPAIRVTGGTVWAPRAAVALREGDVSIPVTLRAWCLFRTGGAEVIGLLHEGSGVALPELLGDGTVKRDVVATGARFYGIPCGAYRVQLAGEEGWRGPFEVAPGEWCIVEVVGG